MVFIIYLMNMNELENICQLKSSLLKFNYKNIPIIANNAFAMSGDKEIFLEGGCSHYLSKPFLSQDLLDLINSALNK